MTPTSTRMLIRPVDDPASPDVDGLLAVRRRHDAEVWPDDPPIPRSELAAELFSPTPHHAARSWLATVGGEPVGAAFLRRELDGVNDGTARLEVLVVPTHRRLGVGRQLAAAALDEGDGRPTRSIVAWPMDEAGAAFCAALGLTARQQDVCSRLRIADLDPAQQRAWIDEAPARAAGYRLVGWVGEVPDEWLEPLARAFDAMADAPMDDVEWQIPPIDGARMRAGIRGWDAQGYDVVHTLAVAPDGSPAGATALAVSRLRPAIGRQGDTGVLRGHRGLGLGRWLKAENLRRALAHQPAMAVVETFNAGSNPHMLAINRDMGFRPVRTFETWQADVDDVMAALRGR
ncbi:MAG TPA: GNAT family N-acetyltransferase [Acidimicrobiales bacterium]|nr:GNAT family N-acetyltransferase [Acidimicrobiales bacterium]